MIIAFSSVYTPCSQSFGTISARSLWPNVWDNTKERSKDDELSSFVSEFDKLTFSPTSLHCHLKKIYSIIFWCGLRIVPLILFKKTALFKGVFYLKWRVKKIGHSFRGICFGLKVPWNGDFPLSISLSPNTYIKR